ncbi:elongation factor P [Candidatus Omnitrophota bacterium]
MIATNQFKNGMTIMLDGQIYQLIYFQHVKPGKGGAFVRTKLKNLTSGNLTERTFRSGEKVEQAFLEQKKIQFMYQQGKSFHFMDLQTYEQFELAQERLGDHLDLLKENTELTMSICKGKILEINLPNFMILKIKHAEPGMRADTVKQAMKTATLETGAKISVPLFIEVGDMVKVDTRTGQYVSRI